MKTTVVKYTAVSPNYTVLCVPVASIEDRHRRPLQNSLTYLKDPSPERSSQLLPYMGTAVKHPVPDGVKPAFVIFDIRTL